MTDQPKTLTTEEAIAHLRTLLAGSTKAPWYNSALRATDDSTVFESHEAMAASMLSSLNFSEARTIYAVWVTGDHGVDDAAYTALTGNGPTSARNAELIATAINWLPMLLNELDARGDQIARANDWIAKNGRHA